MSSRIIYATIVLALITLFSVLPFIKVDVGVRSQGIIRPVTEVVQLSSPVSGNIQALYVAENGFISRGDPVAIIEAPEIKERLRYNNFRTNQLSSFLSDITTLQGAETNETAESITLETPRYQRSWIEFRQNLVNHQHKKDQLKRELTRQQTLYDRDAISEAVLDEAHFAWKESVNRYRLFIEQQQNQWSLDGIAFQEELDQLESEKIRLTRELDRYEIRAPISGTIQNASGVFQNSFVHANQSLGEISPDTSLIAEIFVLPNDIGLLQKGMEVRIQIDAYNHHDWGVVTGRIQSISGDAIMNEGQPLFRVRCSLDKTYLELKNGFRGEIKKGMTLQARFIVTRRSLLQLIFDKADDWLNPMWSQNEHALLTER
ncbi:MAG: HlyD family efflux transporter periplasmic adaptor subunit [Balneolaceae bacterium]|nr:HlyD family efflux transporter periplasmic adaptor subunit [Balneolaceae bacterium]